MEDIRSDAYPAGMNGLTRADGRTMFLVEKASMYMIGNWFVGIFESPVDEGGAPKDRWPEGKLGVMGFPNVKGGKGNDITQKIMGGGIAVNARSKHIKEAVMFLNSLITPEAGKRWVEITQCPSPVKGSFAKDIVGLNLRRTMEIEETARGFLVPWLNCGISLEEDQEFSNCISMGFVSGELSAKEALAGMEKIRKKVYGLK